MTKTVTWSVRPVTRYSLVRIDDESEGKKAGGSIARLGEFETEDAADRAMKAFQNDEKNG